MRSRSQTRRNDHAVSTAIVEEEPELAIWRVLSVEANAEMTTVTVFNLKETPINKRKYIEIGTLYGTSYMKDYGEMMSLLIK